MSSTPVLVTARRPADASARRPRAIGRLGTTARLLVGVALLELGIVGLPPVGSLIPWWQLVLGLVVLPATATLAQLARLRFARHRLQETGAAASMVNCFAVAALLSFTATRAATLVFLGATMVLAAVRGYGGCETLAVSNWLLRRDDQVGCLIFSPLDQLEAHRRA